MKKTKHIKNPIAIEFGKLAIKNLTKEQIMERVNKATARSKYLRNKYGFGYWSNPEIMRKIKKEKL